MAIWDDILVGEDREKYDAYDGHIPHVLGKRPVVVVIDVTNAFIGLKPEPMLESIKTYRNSCGDVGWAALPRIQALLTTARANGVPVLYTRGTTSPLRGGGWASRARKVGDLESPTAEELEKGKLGNTIVEPVAPMPGEIVLSKRAASAFADTPLMQYLHELDADTLIITGTTTSGCVRATAVDASCASFYVGIVEECVFDRFDLSHKVSLMDMHAKYGLVISLAEAQRYLSTEAEPIYQSNRLAQV